MENKKVCAIVLTYNRKNILKECIEALLSLHNSWLKVVVVDNNSSDGTKDMLSNYADKIDYINTGKNIGGAGGFNFGIKYAVDTDADFIWIMDDDAIVLPDSLNGLLCASEFLQNDFGFLCSNIRWIDGTQCRMNIPGFKTESLFEKMEYEKNGIFPVTRASFVSFFIKKDMVKQVGFPIKEFFIWGDDTEYSMRIYRTNQKCYFVAKSLVLHKMTQNIGIDWINENDKKRIDRFLLCTRNEMYICRHYMKHSKVIKQFIDDTVYIEELYHQ